ncbi:MAG: linear amide C-N hydrolase, partial [Clostridia bacterium]|nr:linear amide C-N hydrolase [Clostridia bacterium]
GDYSSASRYVRAAFLKRYLRTEGGEAARVSAVLSLLGAVAPPRGSVLDEEGRAHYTTYSCCMDVSAGRYYVKKADSLGISSVALSASSLDGERLVSFL